ncbi:hypothetical protein BCR32DRAFT_297603 [Anaeromyces robustus]|uniref:Uncharacterized protein n=1 Tax=Anaeromyces robustus TaxID=1754192 RepID=A0A1Y1VZI4_9FUNG|nr:hypothetical protein BCR32DRAFT_297603 [Anaeromyces robustus]|eukprot:ORX66669.1 hypothetical protein BCR32DRAFT_297603 [Anaeromyces robustus]
MKTFEIKEIDDEEFSIIDYCKDKSNNIKSDVTEFIIHHYDNKLWKLIEIIDELDFIKLQKYIENQNIVFNEYDIVINHGNESKKYFSTINYIFDKFDKISQLSPKQKEYLKSRINRKTCDLIKELNNNHYKEFFDNNYSSLQFEFIKKLIYRNPISDFELNKIIKSENKKIIISQSLLFFLLTKNKFEIINKLIKNKLIYMNDYDEKLIKRLYKINKLNENNLNHLIDNDYDIEKLIERLKKDDYKLVKKLIKNDSDKMKSIMRIIDKDHIFDNDCILRFLIIQHNNSPISTKDLKSEIKKEKKKFIKKLCNALFY